MIFSMISSMIRLSLESTEIGSHLVSLLIGSSLGSSLIAPSLGFWVDSRVLSFLFRSADKLLLIKLSELTLLVATTFFRLKRKGCAQQHVQVSLSDISNPAPPPLLPPKKICTSQNCHYSKNFGSM